MRVGTAVYICTTRPRTRLQAGLSDAPAVHAPRHGAAAGQHPLPFIVPGRCLVAGDVHSVPAAAQHRAAVAGVRNEKVAATDQGRQRGAPRVPFAPHVAAKGWGTAQELAIL